MRLRPAALAVSLAVAGCDAGDPSLGPPTGALRAAWSPVGLSADLPPLEVALPAGPRKLTPPADAVDATDYGARPGADGRDAIQAALDAVRPGGTVLIPAAFEPYLLTSAGPNPHNPSGQYALWIPAGVTLWVARGATLQLADEQQTDAGGPVDLVVWDGDDVRVTGGGTIRGNTAGQPGWSGGYQQITAGCLLRSFLPARDAAVTDLHLVDAFSNPVNVESEGPVRLARLRTSAVGEGAQVNWARGVTIEDVEHDDAANVSVGDGVEVSNVDGFAIRRVRVSAGTAGNGGAALDVFGSSNGTVSDFTSLNWSYGLVVHDTFDEVPVVADNVTVRRCEVIGATSTGIESGAGSLGHVRYADVLVRGGGIAVLIYGPAGLPPISLDSLRLENNVAGILLYGSREAAFTGGYALGAHPLDGVLVEDRGGSDAPTLVLRGFSSTGNSRNGVRIEARATTLLIEGGDFKRNAEGAFSGIPSSAIVVGTNPRYWTGRGI